MRRVRAGAAQIHALLARQTRENQTLIAQAKEDAPYSSLVYDYDLAKRCAEYLDRHYPGHLWAVTVNQGVIQVQNMALSGSWGFQIHPKDFDTDYKILIKAGGELLERYNLRRGKMREDDLLTIKRDNLDRPIGDMS